MLRVEPTIEIYWIVPERAGGLASISMAWSAEGLSLDGLRRVLIREPHRQGFPSHLVNEESAYCRWGQRLRWASPLWPGDEIGLLEPISADAKQRRHDKVKRQRASQRG